MSDYVISKTLVQLLSCPFINADLPYCYTNEQFAIPFFCVSSFFFISHIFLGGSPPVIPAWYWESLLGIHLKIVPFL